MSWSAVRVSQDVPLGLKKQVEIKEDAKSLCAPLSCFEGGRIWVQSDGCQPSEEARELQRHGQQVSGSLIGGSSHHVVIDPSKPHYVEPTAGTRRVAVAYTPRELSEVAEADRNLLASLGFPLPQSPAEPQFGMVVQRVAPSTVYHHLPDADPDGEETVDDPWEGRSPECEEGCTAVEGHLTTEDLERCRERLFALRHLILQEEKFLQEQMQKSGDEGWHESAEHVRDLCNWHSELSEVVEAESACLDVVNPGLSHEHRQVARARLSALGVEETQEQMIPLALDATPEEYELAPNRNGESGQPHPEAVLAQEFLQTRTVSTTEVQQELSQWKGSIQEELDSIFDIHNTLKRTTRDQVKEWESQGYEIQLIPSKGVFSRKCGDGRRKTRFVACGNFRQAGELGAKSKDAADQIREKNEARMARQSLYAGGQDVLALRTQLRHAGLLSWTAGSLDIKTAFLLAPLELHQRKIVLKPPRFLVSNNFVPENELWQVTGAIYGLQESPAAWCNFRDRELTSLTIPHEGEVLHLERSAADPNTWLVKDPKDALKGVVGIYIDDLLATGPSAVIHAVFAALRAKWKTSEPKFSFQGEGFNFCGMQVRTREDGALLVSQQDYIQDLLQKYPDVVGEASSPILKELEAQPEQTPQISDIRAAQKIVGEILWVSCRTRPDLAYIISRLGQEVTKQPKQTLLHGQHVLKYLRGTCHYSLVYGTAGSGWGECDQLAIPTNEKAVEIFADASFHPSSDRSQTGLVLTWSGAPVAWLSCKQPTASLSTTEAELGSAIDGLTLGNAMVPLVSELLGAKVKPVLYGDNLGCCSLLQVPQGSWRTRHLRLKAQYFVERVNMQDFMVYHLPGQYMLGDLCTKALQSTKIREFMKMMKFDVTKPEATKPVLNKLWGESHKSDSWTVEHERERVLAWHAEEEVGPDINPGGDRSSRPASNAGGDVFRTGSISSSVASRAVGILSIASVMSDAQGKIVITIDEENKEQLDWLRAVVGVLALVGVLGVLYALCCKPCDREGRATTGDEPEDPTVRALSRDGQSEWSLIDEPGRDAAGIGSPNDCNIYGPAVRFRGSQALRVPNSPREYSGPFNPGSIGIPREGRTDAGGETASGLSGGGLPSEEPSSSSADRRHHTEDEYRPASVAASGAVRVFQAAGDAAAIGREAEVEQALQAEEFEDAPYPGANHRLSAVHPIQVYPPWPAPKQPPRFARLPDPPWGGPAGNCHQIPQGAKDFPQGAKDFWFHDPEREVLIRFHCVRRVRMFSPTTCKLPAGIHIHDLTGRRRTLAMMGPPHGFQKIEDRWDEGAPQRVLPARWLGRTELELHG